MSYLLDTDVDGRIAEEWGRMNVPDPLPVIDGLLAASAKVRGWKLVTRKSLIWPVPASR